MPSPPSPKPSASTPPVFPTPTTGHGSWPEKIDHIRQHIAELRQMIANE
jgi:hypothetical protein